jgi:hypothetical protein
MSKKKEEAAAEEPKNALALIGGEGPVALSNEELDGLTGLGYSDKAEDRLVPIIAILQDNSGEVKKNGSKRVEGAESGQIICRALQKIWNADGSAVFQPCAYTRMWVEWEGAPGEGSVVAQHAYDDMPSDAKEVVDPQNADRKMWVRDNGNRLVDTRFHFGYMITIEGAFAAVIPMAGTNHTVSRAWTSLMEQYQLPGGQKAPAWFRAYTLRTVFVERGAQSWYKFKIEDRGWVTSREQRDAGRRLYESVSAGEVMAATDEVEAEDTSEAPI